MRIIGKINQASKKYFEVHYADYHVRDNSVFLVSFTFIRKVQSIPQSSLSSTET